MIGLYILGNFVLFLGGKIMRNTNSKIFLLILLGSLTAFGPLVTDMYLPSLPSMTDYFGTQASMVQLGLTSSMIGLALGQLFFGPLSDWYGRRPPLLVAMSLFIVSTVCCIFSATIEGFIFFRLIQGIAGAGGIVVSRSIATDRFTGKELAKAMAIIGAINGIAPVASPVLGGFLTDSIGWKGIFIVLLILGVLLLFSNLHFKESLSVDNRKRGNLKSLVSSFGIVLKNRRYVYYVLQMGFAMGVLFANISSSPFIVQQHYGFSAFEFSLFFGINALAIGLAAGLSVKFKNPEHAMFLGSVGMTMMSAVESDIRLLQNKRILLCEDNALNAEMTRDLLENAGMKVDCVFNGQEAVNRIQSTESYYYDAVLMDIRMPVMNGLEATDMIRRMGREDTYIIPIVALTASVYRTDQRKALAAGMDAFLMKPFEVTTLLEKLAGFWSVYHKERI